MVKPCMKEGSDKKKYCKAYFPKDFRSSTKIVTKKIHTEYRRRSPENGGLEVEIDGVMYNNQWVVPYNPHLLSKYDW